MPQRVLTVAMIVLLAGGGVSAKRELKVQAAAEASADSWLLKGTSAGEVQRSIGLSPGIVIPLRRDSRGCSAFGHSCFGGHGKRSESSLDAARPDGARRLGQEETPPHPIYPHSYGVLPSGDDIIPIRDGGAYEREGDRARDALKMKLLNVLRHWMEYYRAARQGDDDGYSFETL